VPGATGARRPAARAAEAGRGRSARRPVGAVDHGAAAEAAGSGAAAGTGGRPCAGAAVRAEERAGTAGRPWAGAAAAAAGCPGTGAEGCPSGRDGAGVRAAAGRSVARRPGVGAPAGGRRRGGVSASRSGEYLSGCGSGARTGKGVTVVLGPTRRAGTGGTGGRREAGAAGSPRRGSGRGPPVSRPGSPAAGAGRSPPRRPGVVGWSLSWAFGAGGRLAPGSSVRRRPPATGAFPWSVPSLPDAACLPTVTKSKRRSRRCPGHRKNVHVAGRCAAAGAAARAAGLRRARRGGRPAR